MRIIPILIPAILAAAPAAAHVGHLGALAGHDHWIAGAALGGAILTGILVGLRGERKVRKAEEREAEADATEEGAEA